MKSTIKTSRTAGQLEKMFRELNKHYYNGELPEPIITLKKTPSAYGHITTVKTWTVSTEQGTEQRYEINISTATLDRPIENTTATLLHEMAHLYNLVHGIRDTSSQSGAYHNKRFKATAEAHGLVIDHHEKYGWTVTSPSEELLDFIIFMGWQDIQDDRGPDVGRYVRHWYGQQRTGQQSGRSPKATQGKEQHPAVDMPQVRNHHSQHQRGSSHLCRLHGEVRKGRLSTPETEMQETSESSPFCECTYKERGYHGNHPHQNRITAQGCRAITAAVSR